MEQENLLVKQAQQGDVHAFAQLYECCYRDLYRFALYNLGQEEDARDVVSDTVLAAFEGIGRLRSAEAFRGWIFQILWWRAFSITMRITTVLAIRRIWRGIKSRWARKSCGSAMYTRP